MAVNCSMTFIYMYIYNASYQHSLWPSKIRHIDSTKTRNFFTQSKGKL